MDVGLENEEGYEDFIFLCQELEYLDDNSETSVDPKKRFHIMDEMRHLLGPDSYKEILRDYT